MKNHLMTVLLILGFSAPLLAQEYEELPDGGVSIDLNIVSNYIFRGDDFHKTAAEGRGIKYGENTGGAAFQPGITLSMPVEGFYFNIWGSYALEHRFDRDQDKLIQQGPNGTDIYASAQDLNGDGDTTDAGIDYQGYDYKNPELPKDFLYNVPKAKLDALMTGNTSDDTDNYSTLVKNYILRTGTLAPGFYKEKNGLSRVDETDISFGYEAETKVGTLGGGIVAYMLPGQATDFGTEFFATYGAPNNVPIYASLHGNDDTGDTAFKVGFAPSIELAEQTELAFDVGATHQVRSANSQTYRGVSHYDVGVSFTTYGFTVGVSGAYRADWRFYDGAYSGDIDAEGVDGQFIKFLGGSTAGDGYVTDRSKQVGPANSYINTITDVIYDDAYNAGGVNSLNSGRGKLPYTYTPRQKLPRWVWFATIGYTVEL